MILLGFNRNIYMFFEGYGRFNPLKLAAGLEKRSYQNLQDALALVDQERNIHKAAGGSIPDELQNREQDLMLEVAERFPGD